MDYYTTGNTILYRDKEQQIRLSYLVPKTLVHVLEDGDMAFVDTNNRQGYIESKKLAKFYSMLSDPYSYVPQDVEIQDAVNRHRPSQYISLKSIGYNIYHLNLCGEFCVAMQLGLDVIPSLDLWQQNYPRAKQILANYKSGTSAYDLISIFDALDTSYKRKSVNLVNPSPQEIWRYIPAILGVGINSSGQVKSLGTIRHWIVCLDIYSVLDNALVLIYNPYWNRLEEILFSEIPDPNGRLTIIY